MLARDFCYWLQGVFEVAEPAALNEKQTELIKRHPAMVFHHEIDPSFGGEEEQEKLANIHGPTTGGLGGVRFNC